MTAMRRLSHWTFACPICHGALALENDDARCDRCDRVYACSGEIWRFLPQERLVQFERFLREYRTVREDQGWGRPDAAYFLALPHVPPDDPQSANWRRRSESCRVLLAQVVGPMAARLGRPLRILDLGAGNCWLAYRLAEMGHQVAAIDLSTHPTDGLGAHAWYRPIARDADLGREGDPEGAQQAHREMPQHGPALSGPSRGYPPFTPIQADFDHLPLPDHGTARPVSGMGTEEGPHGGAAEPIDLAVFNASLHYSRDCGVTLREALRVLSPDGVLVVMDSPVYRQEASGEQMVHERERAFQRTYGFRSDSLPSEHFLTAARLQELARDLTLRWRMYAPVDGPGRRGLPGRVGTPLVGAFRARWRRLRGLREQAQMPVIVGYHAGNRRCAVERQKRISDPSGNPEGTWSCAGAEPDPLTRVLCRPPSGGTGGRGSRAPVSVAEAYDAIAPEYDRQVDDDAWMRRILWRQYAQAFRPGHHVLDVGCGTGTDAVFLARRGVRVTAIDISPAMIARAEGKVAGCGLSAGVRLAVLDIGELGRLPADEFDGIISSFAALNTLPTLTQFGADAARLLRPHGRMILHLLNGSSLHEWAGLMAHGRWTEAWRLGRRRERTFGVGGRPVRHYMPRAEEAYALYFAPHFRLHCARGLGIVRPPCHLGYPATGSAARRWSIPEAALTALGRLDELVGPTHPFVDWGRFVLLEMVRDGS